MAFVDGLGNLVFSIIMKPIDRVNILFFGLLVFFRVEKKSSSAVV
jgi:hypothetical protein